MNIFFNRKLILSFLFIFLIFAGFSIAKAGAKQVGADCMTEVDCASGVCLDNKCASCDNYCKDNDYTNGSCLPTGGVVATGTPKPNYFCDSSQFCNYESLLETGSKYCSLSTSQMCSDYYAEGSDEKITTCTKGGGGNMCWCSKYEQKEACSPDCDLRCGSSGCGELKKGFAGCRFGANFLTSRVCSWNLQAGYNLISFPINVSAENIKKSFSVISGKYSSIQIYNREKSQWEEFDLASVYAGSAPNSYLVKMNQGASFAIEGNMMTAPENAYDWIKNTVNSLPSGWNLVAFPYVGQSVSLPSFFSAADFGVTKISSLAWGSANTQEASWAYFLPVSKNGSLLQIEPGKAYWIFKSSRDSLKCDFAKCGQGFFNICDEKECLGLGACYFESGIIWGKCVAKCNHDSECQNSCSSGKFSACDLTTNKCGCEDICTDSDNSSDIFTFGVAGGKKDNCKDANNVEEFYCLDNRVKSKIEKCPFGCGNGFCKPACVDSDGGKKYDVAGFASNEDPKQTVKDVCSADGISLIEAYCDPNSNPVLTETIVCPFGCKDGICYKTADKRVDVLFIVTGLNTNKIETLETFARGVKVLISKKGATAVLTSCITNGIGECSANLPAGDYTAKIDDSLFTCNNSDCPKSFTVEGVKSMTVSLYPKFAPPKTAMCIDSDGGENFDEKGTVKVWWSPSNSTKGRFSLGVYTDTCRLMNQVNEYSCGDVDGNGIAHELSTRHDCPYGCFDGVCVKSCAEEFGKGFVCAKVFSGIKDSCSTGVVKETKTLSGDGYCNLAGETKCVLCEQTCQTANDCYGKTGEGFIQNCPSYHAAKCGADKKCYCEKQQQCQSPADCGDMTCPVGETTSCSSAKVCFCLKGALSKTIKVRVSDAISGLKIAGVEVKIIDEKQSNKEVGSCATAKDGACQLEAPLVFSGEHSYWAITKNVKGYEDAKLELLSESNSANFYAYLDLEPSSGGSNNNGGAIPPEQTGTGKTTFKIDIKEGENLISSPFVEPLTISEIKKAGCEFKKDISSAGNIEKFLLFFNGFNSSYVDQIGMYQAGFIHIAKGCSFEKTGSALGGNIISLYAGLNIISVNKETTIQDIANNCKDKILGVYAINNGLSVEIKVSDKVYPGKGYYIKVSSVCELRVSDKPSAANSSVVANLGQNCGVLYKSTDDYSKAINFILVPADSLFGTLLNNSNAQYTNNLDAFIIDAKKNIDDFLSVTPISNYKNIFNFFYSKDVIKCVDSNDRVVCNFWEKSANNCNVPYDQVIILQRKEGGGLGGTPIQSSSLTTLTLIHEIGHYFGLRDYDDLSIPVGPNYCLDFSCCGGSACGFKNYEDKKPIETGGPNCCLHLGDAQNKSFYVSNEQSAMHYDINYKAYKFNQMERTYLNNLFLTILSQGKESVKCYSMLKTKEYCF